MKKFHVVIAGLLTILTVSAISTPGFGGNTASSVTQVINDVSFFKTPREVVCANTTDIKKELQPFESVWAGINRNEDDNSVTSVVEVLMQDNKWVIVEHYSVGVSCVIGVGEEWAFNPKSRRKLGVTI